MCVAKRPCVFQAAGLIAVGQRLAPLSKARTPHPGRKLSRIFSIVGTFSACQSPNGHGYGRLWPIHFWPIHFSVVLWCWCWCSCHCRLLCVCCCVVVCCVLLCVLLLCVVVCCSVLLCVVGVDPPTRCRTPSAGAPAALGPPGLHTTP